MIGSCDAGMISGVGMAVGGTGVAVDGIGVLVGGKGVLVGGIGVLVGGTGVGWGVLHATNSSKTKIELITCGDNRL